jgi:hypothetical protein
MSYNDPCTDSKQAGSPCLPNFFMAHAPAGVVLWHVFEIGTLLQAIDQRVERFGR